MKKPILVLSLSLLWVCSSLGAQWIAKIGGKDVPVKEFQEYLGFLKDSQGKDAIEAAVKDPDELKGLFQGFLDQKILLAAAAKAGFTRQSPAVQKVWQEQGQELLLNFYLGQQLSKYGSPRITEDDLKAFFKKINQVPNRTWEALQDAEKAQVQQLVLMDRRQADQKKYLTELEGRYKVKRKPKPLVSATFDNVTIKDTEVSEMLERELATQGVRGGDLLRSNPKQYDEFMNKALDGLLLRKLIASEIQKTGFSASPSGAYAQDALQDSMVTQLFLQENLVNRISVTDAELNEEFKRNEKAFQGQPFDKVHEYLKTMIRQRKSQRLLQTFMVEVREDFQIQRNREELKKIQ